MAETPTADYITRGKEILAEQPKVVIKIGVGLHVSVLEGREHIGYDELISLVNTFRAAGIEGPIEEPIEILLSTETKENSLFENPETIDVICSLIATANTTTGLKVEISPGGRRVDAPVIIVEGSSDKLRTPAAECLAKLALNKPWQAYEESQRGLLI